MWKAILSKKIGVTHAALETFSPTSMRPFAPAVQYTAAEAIAIHGAVFHFRAEFQIAICRTGSARTTA